MKNFSPSQIEAYVVENNLQQVINFHENQTYQKKATDTVDGHFHIPFPPEKSDLVRLHSLVRERKPFTVLEFGVGYSTPIIADALHKNKMEYDSLVKKPIIRNRFLFKLFSVDASKKWIAQTKKRIPKHLKKYITFHFSEVSITTFNDKICHMYDTLPDIIPEFVYVDAPDCKQVKGSIHGLSFQCDERTVMAADLLLMEPTFLPGTFILIDGRTNNARFLQRNFQRNYRVSWNSQEDITTMELIEKPLGRFNIQGSKIYSK